MQFPIATTSPDALTRNRIVANAMNDAHTDTFRLLRAQVLMRLAGSTLAIASCHPDEGKSFVAANLAVSMAMNINHSVLLVDLDLRKPGLHELFGVEPAVGLNDYFSDDAGLSDCIVQLEKERLYFLPNRKSAYVSFESISHSKIIEMSEELKTKFTYIIYDLPPLLWADDCMVFMKHVDACLFVVREGLAEKSEIQRAMRILKGHEVVGTVLNNSRSEDRQASYYG